MASTMGESVSFIHWTNMKIVADTYIYPDGFSGHASDLAPLLDTSRYNGDSDYVHGAIDFQINSTILFDKTMWDLVDQLWVYIVIAMEQASFSQGAEFYFPDQPILVSVNSRQMYWELNVKYYDTLRLCAVSREVKVPGHELLSHLMPLAVRSLEAFQRLIPRNADDYGKYIDVARRIGNFDE